MVALLDRPRIRRPPAVSLDRRPILPDWPDWPDWSDPSELPRTAGLIRMGKWRRILGGLNAFTAWAVGGCGCGCSGCPFPPCTLPIGSNLTLSYLNTAGPYSATKTLTYMLVEGSAPYSTSCNWATGSFDVTGEPGGNGHNYFIAWNGPGPNCFWYVDTAPLMIGVNSMLYDPGSCSGSGAVAATLTSYTCSPLNIVFTRGTRTWTITP